MDLSQKRAEYRDGLLRSKNVSSPAAKSAVQRSNHRKSLKNKGFSVHASRFMLRRSKCLQSKQTRKGCGQVEGGIHPEGGLSPLLESPAIAQCHD